MTSRNRQAKLKARLGIATAVLVGGGAIGGVAAVAASGHGSTTNARNAGYTINFRHNVPMGTALSSALSSMQHGRQGRALSELARMRTMRNFAQTMHHGTTFAAQRGVIEVASRHFIVVKSANGSLHLWWVAGNARFVNASASGTAMAAMTGSNSAASSAMTTGNMTPATMTMAGGTAMATTMAAPATRPTTLTIQSGNATITITITSSTATVSAPATTPATTTSTSSMTTGSGAMASGPTTMTRQSAFLARHGVARGDMALVTGVRFHGFLIAKMVVFTPPTTVTPTPSASPSATTSVAPTATPTATTAPAPTATSSFTGNNS